MAVLLAIYFFFVKGYTVGYKTGAYSVVTEKAGWLVKGNHPACQKDQVSLPGGGQRREAGGSGSSPRRSSGSPTAFAPLPTPVGRRIVPYGLLSAPPGSSSREVSCVGVVASPSQADGLLGKKVLVKGVLVEGVLYAREITEISDSAPREPRPSPVRTPAPTPTPTVCPGLGFKAACDPKAASPQRQCCSPFVCMGGYCNIDRPRTQ